MRSLYVGVLVLLLGCAGSSTETPPPATPTPAPSASSALAEGGSALERAIEGPVAALLKEADKVPQLSGLASGDDAITSTEGCQPSQASAPLVLQSNVFTAQDIASSMQTGVAPVVAFDCKELRVLRCGVNATYKFQGYTRKQESARVSSERGGEQRVPLLGTGFTRRFAPAEMYELELVTVGVYSSSRTHASADELVGSCAGATHFLRGTTIGALKATSTIRGPGRSSTSSRSEGDVTACSGAQADAATPPSRCSAIVRLDLVPISATRRR